MRSSPSEILPDYLRPGLRVVFVSTVVGDTSALKGHYYSRRGNAFWELLFQSRIVDRPLKPEDDVQVNDFGVGLTDIVKHTHTSNDVNLSRYDLKKGAGVVRRKMRQCRPVVVCFNGKNAFRAFFGRTSKPHYGPADERIGDSLVFTVPSTSGRVPANRLLDGRTRLEWFVELNKLLNAM